MSDIAVAMILLALSGVVIVAMAIICRVLGVWKLSTLFGMGEEKVNLTKNEHHYNAYTAHVSFPNNSFHFNSFLFFFLQLCFNLYNIPLFCPILFY